MNQQQLEILEMAINDGFFQECHPCTDFVSELSRMGLLTREGNGYNTRYTITDAGRTLANSLLSPIGEW